MNSRVSNRIWSRFQYLYGSRNYSTDDIDDSNLNREDTRNELRENLSIKLSGKWWLNLFAEYENNDSTRDERDSNNIEVGMGIFVRFP